MFSFKAKQPFNHEEVITTYKSFIRRLPKPNQYLLLYVLDLLSVFARKSDKNLMTATSMFPLPFFHQRAIHFFSFSPDLAVIFRPGLISHPQHEMSPQEHALSQSVLEFLIAQQDWFMLDIAPPPEGSPTASWDQGVRGNTGFEGKWKEGEVGGHSREGVETPNAHAEAGPSMQRGQVGPSKNPHPQPQSHPHAPSPRQAHNAQSQPSLLPQSQSLSQLQSQQLHQPQPISQQQYSSSPGNSGYGSDVDDVMVVPNSDGEYDENWKIASSAQGGGGIGSGFMGIGGGRGKGEVSKVVFKGDKDAEKGREKEKGIKSMRRRTAMDRSGKIFCLFFWSLMHLSQLELSTDTTNLSPLDTTQSPPIMAGVGVTRSRTLPSRKKGGGDDTLGIESSGSMSRGRGVEKRVLKKQRRVSGGGITSTTTTTPNRTPSPNVATTSGG